MKARFTPIAFEKGRGPCLILIRGCPVQAPRLVGDCLPAPLLFNLQMTIMTIMTL